jgi:hypothetical protein
MSSDLSVHANEHPARPSRYLRAGAPTRCQNRKCKRPFADRCHRGHDERYYCSEECAQVGAGVDLEKFANVVRLGSAPSG